MKLQNGNFTSIYLDFKVNSIHYYSLNNGRVVHDTRKIIERPFTSEYYNKLTENLKDLINRYTPASAANTTIVLPDSAVFQNIASFPALKSTDFSKSLNIHLNTTYPNFKDLNINSKKIVNNKQYTQVLVTGVLKDVIGNIKVACNNAKFIPGNFTFASNATICGIKQIAQKYNNATYMFLDIKEHFARFIIVYKGIVLGNFELPIGYSCLLNNKLSAEDVLLYQSHAELLVVNAKEKAKQKALTMSGADNVTSQDVQLDDEENEEDEENSFAGFDNREANRQAEVTIKTLPKKVARKLPKFMQRELPLDEEHYSAENFRMFVKWALGIMHSNDTIFSLAKCENVYVNVPKEFNFIFDICNEEITENGVKFVPAGLTKEKEDIYSNLEMFGALSSKDTKNTIMF